MASKLLAGGHKKVNSPLALTFLSLIAVFMVMVVNNG